MKRVLSCILITAILMSVCYVSFAETSETENIEFKYEVLNKLEIIPERTHGDYGILRDLSKNIFLAYVCNIYGGYGYTEEYTDEAVLKAEELGLIHKNQTDLHKPISYNEAMTILVRLLSYGTHAEENGGFPYGYNRIASSVGLADGLSVGSGQILKEHDIVTLLYNAINAPYAQIEYITEDSIVYSNQSDKTILHELRGIYRIDGIVEATETAMLRPDETVGEDKIRIEGYVYSADEDFEEYLGMNVVAYVKEDKSDDDKVVALIPDKNDELVIFDKEISGPSADFKSIEYFNENGKLSKVSIDNMATVIYNGQPLATYTKEAFMPADGHIRFINNNGKAGFDVVEITSFKTIVADSVSKLTKAIYNTYSYDEENLLLNTEANNEDVIKLFGDNGEISFSDISEGAVIRVAKSLLAGRTVVKAYVSENKIAGIVSQMNTGDDTKITVDGAEYTLSVAFEEAIEKNDSKAVAVKTGGSYTFSLDDAGRIAFAKNTEGMEQYGIVYAIASQGVWQSEYTLKIFTSEGEWKLYPLAEKVSLDDVKTTADSVVSSIKCSKDGNVSLIGYTLNSDGEISNIKTPEAYDNGNNGRFNKIEKFSDNYRSNNSSFDSEIFIKDKCVMWFVNTESPAEEESYTIGAKSILQGDESCTISAYNINEGMFADLFIVERSSSSTNLSVQIGELFVIDEISQVIMSDGNTSNMLTGKIGSYEKFSYYCEDDSIIKGLGKGDIISFHTDSNGNIDKIEKYRSLADGEIYSYPSAMHAVAAVPQGKVIDHDPVEKWIKIDCGGEKPRIVRTANVSSVIIYDKETEQLYNGSLSDIEKGALITTKLKWSRATTVVVYQ